MADNNPATAPIVPKAPDPAASPSEQHPAANQPSPATAPVTEKKS